MLLSLGVRANAFSGRVVLVDPWCPRGKTPTIKGYPARHDTCFFFFEQVSASKIKGEPNPDQIEVPRKQNNLVSKGLPLDQREDPCEHITKPFMGNLAPGGGKGGATRARGPLYPARPPFAFVEWSSRGASVATGCEGS